MARTKINPRSARVDVPMGATGGRTPPSKMTVALLVTCIVSAVWAAGMLTPFGRQAYVYLFLYSEYYMGVLTLVSLSITVMIGLVATDRLVLSIRQRVLLQSAHRTTGVIAVGALVVHVATKFSTDRIVAWDIFIPFLAPYNTLYIGFGTISGLLLVSVLWTGLARAKFAGRGKPWMWRSLHSVAYLAWPIALVHGLSAGRAAAAWVIVSYIVCVLFVLVGLAVRLSVSLNRKKDFSSTVTGALKPVGTLVPTSAPVAKKRGGRWRDAPEVAPIGEAPAWRPAAAPAAAPAPVAVAAPPVSAPPYAEEAPARSGRYVEEAPARSGRYVEEAPARSGRYVEEAPASSDRRVGAAPGPRDRYVEDSPGRGGRYAEAPARGPRYVEDDEPLYQEGSGRPGRYDDEQTRIVPARRRAERFDDDDARYDDGPIRGRAGDDEFAVRPRRSADEPRYDEPPVRRAIESRAITSAPHSRHAEEVPAARGYAPGRFDDVPTARGHRDEPRSRGRLRAEDTPERYDGGRGPDDPPRRSRSGGYTDNASRYRDDAPYSDAVSWPGRDPDPAPRDAAPRRTGSRSDAAAARRSGGRVDADAGRSEDRWDAAPRRSGSRLDAAPRRSESRSEVQPDSGRHSRSEFVDLADTDDPNYLPPDETPTLVDMAARRARRATRTETARPARRAARGPAVDEISDDRYWRQLRGEAQ